MMPPGPVASARRRGRQRPLWWLVSIACGVLALGGARSSSAQTAAGARSQPSTATADAPLRILTFNIHHGEGMDGRLDLERIAAVIRESRADIVGLQEVDRGVERTARRDIVKELADLTGLHYAFGKNIDLQGGDYGNALLSRFAIVSEGNRPLEPVGGGEQRGVLQTVLDVQGRRLLVLVTHLDHRADSAQRPRSAEEIKAMIAAWGDGPLVLMGDFNDGPDSRAHQTLTTVAADAWEQVGTGDGFTIPVSSPRRRIDWILLRGLDPVEGTVIQTDASDHLPLLIGARWPR